MRAAFDRVLAVLGTDRVLAVLRLSRVLAVLVLCVCVPSGASAEVRSSSTATRAGGLFDEGLELPSGPSGAAPVADAWPTDTSTSSGGAWAAEGALFDGALPEAGPELGAAAFTPRVTWSVRLGASVAVDTSFERRGEHILEVGLTGRLELHADLLPRMSAHVLPHFSQVTALDREGGDRATIDLPMPEAYVTLAFDHLRLRVGALVHAWGSTELITPNDILNPVDLRRSITTARDGVRIPVLGAEASLALSPLTLRAVVQPFFASSRFYLYGWDTGFAPLVGAQGVQLPDLDGVLGRATADRVSDELLVVDRPSERIDHLTAALRATLTLGDLDVSGNVVWGYEPLPRLALDPDLSIVGGAVLDAIADERPIDFFDQAVAEAFGRLQEKLEKKASLIEGTYPRRVVVGLDATYALDPVILKLDVAYTVERTHYTQTFAPVALPAVDVVLGVEYLRGESLQVTAELFALGTLDVPGNLRLAVLEPRGLGAGEARAVVVPGLALAGRYAVLDGELALEVLLAATLTRGDLVFLPQLVWRASDHHSVRLGGLLVQGPADGYGGAYDHTDQLVLGYEWSP